MMRRYVGPPHDPMIIPTARTVRRPITPMRSEQPRPAEQPGTVSSSEATTSAAKHDPLAVGRNPAPPFDANVTEHRPRGPAIAAILKSGVIEARPYTLYADGSIVVDLPQGQMKFASAEALRLHIEGKN